MARYVAFLRGMNLGRRRITNDELCASFRELGFSKVSAFLASGNVLFDAEAPSAGDLGRSIEEGLAEALGYPVPTFLRTGDEVRSLAALQPFSETELASRGKPQVMLLERQPSARERQTVLGLSTDEDRLVLADRELFWLPSAGILDTELDLKLIEKTVGPNTMRTLNTVVRLARKLG